MITEKINLTNEQILKLKEMYEKYEVVKFPAEFDSIDFVGAFNELKEWFKWDLDKYQYTHLTDSTESHTVKKFLNTASDTLFKGYDIVVFAVIVELAIIESAGLVYNSDLNLIEETIEKFENDGEIYGKLDPYYNSKFDTDKYSELAHYVLQEFNYTDYTQGLIRNRMGDDDFETFFRKYKAILQKHILGLLVSDPSITTVAPVGGLLAYDPSVTTINTTATPVDESVVTNKPQVTPVAPTYQLNYNSDPYAKTRAKFGFVPLAHVALQYNPVGCWFYDNQLGIYRSQFVDYHKLNCMTDKVASRKYIESITKIMSNPVIYEEILQHMPVIGTKFKDAEPVLLKFISGSNIYSTKYAIGCEYNGYSLVFVCDVITNTINTSYFGKTAEVSVAVNNFRV